MNLYSSEEMVQRGKEFNRVTAVTAVGRKLFFNLLVSV